MITIPAAKNTVAVPVAEASRTAAGTATSHEGPASARRPCPHQPPCPGAQAPDRDAARIASAHPEQGWYLLCNGVIRFDDTGELLPDGRAIAPHRAVATAPEAARAADQFVPSH